MPKISRRASQTPSSKIRRVFNKSLGHDDWVKFTVGEPDFDTDQTIIEAAYQAALMGNTHMFTMPGFFHFGSSWRKNFMRINI